MGPNRTRDKFQPAIYQCPVCQYPELQYRDGVRYITVQCRNCELAGTGESIATAIDNLQKEGVFFLQNDPDFLQRFPRYKAAAVLAKELAAARETVAAQTLYREAQELYLKEARTANFDLADAHCPVCLVQTLQSCCNLVGWDEEYEVWCTNCRGIGFGASITGAVEELVKNAAAPGERLPPTESKLPGPDIAPNPKEQTSTEKPKKRSSLKGLDLYQWCIDFEDEDNNEK